MAPTLSISLQDLWKRWLQVQLPTNIYTGAVDPTGLAGDYPVGAVPVQASSGNVANAAATATLPAAAGKTTYMTGFTISGAGATAALVVNPTIVGLLGGTATYTYTFVAGVTTPNTTLAIRFFKPLPGSAINTAIVVSCPAGGAGNTNNTVSVEGYQL